ncbi:MAG TPA: response regulator [Rhodobacteraceae bacterium]|nr:response regulator [Paracoccaceae bacterium]
MPNRTQTLNTNDAAEDPATEIARLKEIIRQKDQFLATVSHEVRSPMNGVFGMADALSRTSLDDKQKRYLSVLRDACDSMLSIANQLLEKGKLDSGQTTLVPVDFDIGEFVASQVAEFAGRAEKGGLMLELDTKILTDSRIRFDKMRLAQVLGNLISNAIRYTDEGRVVVRVILQAGKDDKLALVLSVEDSGIGIAPDKHAQIFEAFSSADPEQSANRGGTGLGLNVVRDLVELMNGRIKVDSTLGLGSTFTVELSVDIAESHADEVETVRHSMPQNLHLLLAEDNDSNAFVFEVLLEDTGVKTTRVRNGQEAVIAFEKGEFDVIFMDIQMPVMNGIQATAAIRAAEGAVEKPVPIIALSADTVAAQCSSYQAARFTDAIFKPMRQKDLLDMLSIFDKE